MTKQLSRIEALRLQLKEEKERAKNGGKSQFQNSRNLYPFWNMKEGESCTIRILPDKNEDNPHYFFVDRLEHTISINGENQRIPCRKMYGDSCPICEQSQAYYKMDNEDEGKKYYRKKQSMLRILVLEDPLPPNESGETFVGKTCNAQFANELMTLIKHEITDPSLGDFADLDEGTDFVITKTMKGKYAVYNVGSGFARRPSAVPQEYRAGIELIDLETLLPKDFGLEKVTNMLNAHNTGGDYVDPDKKPKNEKQSLDTSAEKPVVEKKTVVKETPVKEAVSEPVYDDADGDDDNGDDDTTTVVTKTTATESSQDTASDEEPVNLLAELRRKREQRAARR